MFKLRIWNHNWLRFPVKAGFKTREGLWTSEQRGALSTLRLEVPGPGIYDLELVIADPPALSPM